MILTASCPPIKKRSVGRSRICKGQKQERGKGMPDFNVRLLNEIAHLLYLKQIEGIELTRITHCLEMLRFVRNTELGLNFEQGQKEEDEWIAQNPK